MPEVRISVEVLARIREFKTVVETVIESDIGLDQCAEIILSQGMDAMLADLLASVDDATLLKSFQQLGSQFPAQVYGYVAETLRRGAASQAKEALRQQIGFHASPKHHRKRRPLNQ